MDRSNSNEVYAENMVPVITVVVLPNCTSSLRLPATPYTIYNRVFWATTFCTIILWSVVTGCCCCLGCRHSFTTTSLEWLTRAFWSSSDLICHGTTICWTDRVSLIQQHCLSLHLYADDTQIDGACDPSDVGRLLQCYEVSEVRCTVHIGYQPTGSGWTPRRQCSCGLPLLKVSTNYPLPVIWSVPL